MDGLDTESSSDNPAAAKRLKLESQADDDEDISILGESISVRPTQVAGGTSPTALPSQISDGGPAEDNQDSKAAEFRNKMLKYEAEASHLRTQLKREYARKALHAEREKARAEGVKYYLEAKCEEERKRANEAEAVAQQKSAAAEKKAKDLQKQCERLETKVQSKEAEIDVRDKQLGHAAKDLNEARKKADNAEKEAPEAKKKAIDAEQNEAVASAKAVEADAKKTAAEKTLEELKKNKTAAERLLKTTKTQLENRLAHSEATKHPSSSTDEQLAESLNEANGRIVQQVIEIAALHADNDNLKKALTASEARASRLEGGIQQLDAQHAPAHLRGPEVPPSMRHDIGRHWL